MRLEAGKVAAEVQSAKPGDKLSKSTPAVLSARLVSPVLLAVRSEEETFNLPVQFLLQGRLNVLRKTSVFFLASRSRFKKDFFGTFLLFLRRRWRSWW